MYKKKSLTVGLACAALAVGAIVAVPATSAQAAYSGISVADACGNQYPGTWQKTPILAAYNVMGWRCQLAVNGGWAQAPVDLSRWCRTKYREQSAYATYSNFNNPYSWICVY